MFGYSHRTIITRALFHTAMWWPCWWLSQWVRGPLAMTLGKLTFYTNNFYMALFWYFIHSIAKGTEPTPKDTVKYLAFWLTIHILIEIPLILSSI